LEHEGVSWGQEIYVGHCCERGYESESDPSVKCAYRPYYQEPPTQKAVVRYRRLNKDLRELLLAHHTVIGQMVSPPAHFLNNEHNAP